MKKIFAIVLAIVLCISCFTACSLFDGGSGMGEGAGGSSKKEPAANSPMATTPSGKQPGLYNSVTGEIKYTWAELEAKGYVTVKDNVLTKSVSYLIGDLYIPNGVLGIAKSAFSGCTGLTGVHIGDGVTTIGTSAFSWCTALLTVELGKNVSNLSEKCFSNCTRLAKITIPDSVTIIGSSAFVNCNGLKSVHVGDGVTRISGSAFSGCTGLNEIRLGHTVSYIGDSAFDKCEVLYTVNYDGTTSEWSRIVIGKTNACLHNAYKKTLDQVQSNTDANS